MVQIVVEVGHLAVVGVCWVVVVVGLSIVAWLVVVVVVVVAAIVVVWTSWMDYGLIWRGRSSMLGL